MTTANAAIARQKFESDILQRLSRIEKLLAGLPELFDELSSLRADVPGASKPKGKTDGR